MYLQALDLKIRKVFKPSHSNQSPKLLLMLCLDFFCLFVFCVYSHCRTNLEIPASQTAAFGRSCEVSDRVQFGESGLYYYFGTTREIMSRYEGQNTIHGLKDRQLCNSVRKCFSKNIVAIKNVLVLISLVV